jgi:hypothetical protein
VPISSQVLEPLGLISIAALFASGYLTRSYLGAAVPGVALLAAIYGYTQRGPDTGDEVDVLPAVFVVLSAIAVLAFLGGVALGRRARARR